ncbi:lysophospholipid acyltransferase family protein [Pseudoroseicyclus tamaricis]|uniref:1-acyl-sn-glycerol-3-phosphate acyltransferase n=1 Tax=Pseudoroseicyclus tamaricis TaxID=2705421 RepID=A0A6B2JLB5_9RHOB|nr:lysophospholipid acyltransferase family protein [Pseudoroseicyclus tamaricis]NDU99406.1 1-acyl-sn-glycerol-3-phosphate acyltransferase [Pseudoroseicyclus tamaricis]
MSTWRLRWQGVKSLVFIIVAYPLMALYAIVFLPYALVSPLGASAAAKSWAWTARWLLKVIVGLRTEVRGEIPKGEVLIAAKHQSFLDIIMIYSVVPRGKFIMKRELLWAPIIGLYAWRAGCIPVNRGKRAEAIRSMVADVRAGKSLPGQVVIYPQGTRIAPGVKAPFKVGAAALYQELKQPCIPAATNVGLFWSKSGLMRMPGLAVVEFLPAIPPGLSNQALMARLEAEIETASDRLLLEGGFSAPSLPKREA